MKPVVSYALPLALAGALLAGCSSGESDDDGQVEAGHTHAPGQGHTSLAVGDGTTRQRGRLLARRPAGPRAARRHRRAALPHRRPRGRAGHRLRRGAHQGAAPLRRQRRPDRVPPPAPHPRRGRQLDGALRRAGRRRLPGRHGVHRRRRGRQRRPRRAGPPARPPAGRPGRHRRRGPGGLGVGGRGPDDGTQRRAAPRRARRRRPAGRARHLPRGLRPRHRLPPRDRRDGAPAPARSRPRSPRTAPS